MYRNFPIVGTLMYSIMFLGNGKVAAQHLLHSALIALISEPWSNIRFSLAFEASRFNHFFASYKYFLLFISLSTIFICVVSSSAVGNLPNSLYTMP